MLEQMGPVGTAAVILGSLALVFGLVLAVAYRFLKVEEDPRIDQVEELLPGANCGACGEPGCRAFAEKVVAGDASPAKCTVNSPENIEAIADLLGIEAGSVDKVVARLHCAGGQGLVKDMARYQGAATCGAAKLVAGGSKDCPWGCLGFGDCMRVCQFDAIHMNPQGLPVVDVDRCTACGDCVEVCPLELFSLQPLSQKVVLQCRSRLAGETARDACQVACDACGRCVMDAPEGAMEMKDNLPHILNPDVLGPACTFRCPTGAIQWVDKNQFTRNEEETKSWRKHG